jgi:hypothetical protein
MKFSDTSINILKNFSSISPQLVIRENCGEIAIRSPTKDVVAMATLPETFTKRIIIPDLKKFLSIIGIISDYSIDVESESNIILIKGNNETIRYVNGAEDLVFFVEPKKINLEGVITFLLENTVLEKIRKAASIIGIETISICPSKDEGLLEITLKNSIRGIVSHSFSQVISGQCTLETGTQTEILININRLNILPGTYLVTVSKNKILRLKLDDVSAEMYNLSYLTTLDKDTIINGH